MDDEAIKKQAKAIMDDFMAALSKAGVAGEKFGIERKKCTRAAGESCGSEKFRQLVFENAPKKSDDFIAMERKGW